MRRPAISGPLWQIGLGRENGLAFWGLFFIEGSFGAFFPIWPLFIEELGAPITFVGLLLGLGGVFRLFVLLPTANIARRIGGKRLLLWCRIISSVSVGAAALAPSWPWLIPVLLGTSVGSMAFPIILSHISAYSSDRDRVRAFSLAVTIGPSIAMLIAPLISSGLIRIFDLRAALIFSALLSLVSVFILTGISERRSLGIEEEGEGQESPAESSGYRAAFADSLVRNILLLKLVSVFALGLGSQLIPNYLRDVGGYSDDTIALLAAFSAVGTIAFGTLVVRNQRFNDAPLLGAAIAVATVSVGFLLFFALPEVPPAVVIGFLCRGGIFAAISLFSAVLGSVASPRNREHIFTLSEIFIVGGFSFAPIVAGILFDIWPALPLLISAIASVPIVLVLLRMSAHRRAEPEVEPVTTA